jgi:hypothetical protein
LHPWRCFEAGGLAQTQSSAKVYLQVDIRQFMNERSLSMRFFIMLWRASDEPDLKAHSRREDQSGPFHEDLIRRIPECPVAFMT